jgi:hypothetical protein
MRRSSWPDGFSDELAAEHLRPHFWHPQVRADEEGSFTLYPVPGHWRLLAWVPSVGRTDREVEVGSADLEVRLELR